MLTRFTGVRVRAIAVLALLLALAGWSCGGSKAHRLQFGSGEEATETLTWSVIDDDVQMQLSGVSRLDDDCRTYRLTLYVELQTNRMAGELDVFPNDIAVFVEDEPMQLDRSYDDEIQARETVSETWYEFPLNYYFSGLAIEEAVRSGGSLEVEVLFGGFLRGRMGAVDIEPVDFVDSVGPCSNN